MKTRSLCLLDTSDEAATSDLEHFWFEIAKNLLAQNLELAHFFYLHYWDTLMFLSFLIIVLIFFVRCDETFERLCCKAARFSVTLVMSVLTFHENHSYRWSGKNMTIFFLSQKTEIVANFVGIHSAFECAFFRKTFDICHQVFFGNEPEGFGCVCWVIVKDVALVRTSFKIRL